MLLDDICDYLTSGGAATQGTDLFAGFMPETPDVMLSVYETGGQAPVHAMSAGVGQVVRRPRIQVTCRASAYDYATARTKAEAVYALLDGLGDRTINGTAYKYIAAVQEPFLIGRDEAGRVLVGCNYDIISK